MLHRGKKRHVSSGQKPSPYIVSELKLKGFYWLLKATTWEGIFQSQHTEAVELISKDARTQYILRWQKNLAASFEF